jgi:hypothetical protein
MNAARKAQIKWWASNVQTQATEYADIADPKRTRTDAVANKLDAIASLCRKIQAELEHAK